MYSQIKNRLLTIAATPLTAASQAMKLATKSGTTPAAGTIPSTTPAASTIPKCTTPNATPTKRRHPPMRRDTPSRNALPPIHVTVENKGENAGWKIFDRVYNSLVVAVSFAVFGASQYIPNGNKNIRNDFPTVNSVLKKQRENSGGGACDDSDDEDIRAIYSWALYKKKQLKPKDSEEKKRIEEDKEYLRRMAPRTDTDIQMDLLHFLLQEKKKQVGETEEDKRKILEQIETIKQMMKWVLDSSKKKQIQLYEWCLLQNEMTMASTETEEERRSRADRKMLFQELRATHMERSLAKEKELLSWILEEKEKTVCSTKEEAEKNKQEKAKLKALIKARKSC